MAVPARYRTVLADWCDSMLVATIDTTEKCILIYPLPEWEVIQEKIGLNRAKARVAADLSGRGVAEIEAEQAMERAMADDALLLLQ